MKATDKTIKEKLLSNNPRHVTFSDQSESGYSTTTSSDEGHSTTMTSGEHYDVTHELNSTFPPWQSSRGEARPIDPSHIDKLYRYRNINQPTMLPDPLGPSASSPVYYDPLHLRNLGQDPLDSVQNSRIFDENLKRDSADSWVKRGILKKNVFHSQQNAAVMNGPISTVYPVHGSTTFAQSTPPRYANVSHSSTPPHNPVHVLPFNPNESNGSPLTTMQLPHRKSAFTPVMSRRKISGSTGDLTSSGSQGFSPVKAPPVLDFVTSSVVSGNYQMEKPHVIQKDQQYEAVIERKAMNAHHFTADPNQYYASPPIPAPRKKTNNLPQTFNSLSLHNGPAPISRIASSSTPDPRIPSSSAPDSRTSNSCSSGSPSSQVEALTNEAARLRHFLDKASAKDLKRFLRDQLESKNPKMIKALSTLVPMSKARQIESHCVRCHKVSMHSIYKQ